MILGVSAGPALADVPQWPPAVFSEVDPLRAALGRDLFYDPILSGSQTVSCATCHHPDLGTSDAVSLSLGDGATGLGPERRIVQDNIPERRIPRNAPALFNLGADEFTVMFHDGRLEADENEPNGIRTPLGPEMVQGFDSILSAQAMFPVLSGDEMAGHYSENPIAQLVRQGRLTGDGGAWDMIAQRINAVPTYRESYANLTGTSDAMAFTDAANLIADFIRFEWQADNAPFDNFLRTGEGLSQRAERGLDLFYGAAGCGTCHSGRFQTDHNFHAIAMPQIGPGKAARFESHARDTGRMRVTGDPADAYRFRTPSLRNVALTAPYGHSGSYATLEGVIRHHLDPVGSLKNYDRSQAVFLDLPQASDFRILDDPAENDAIAGANELQPVKLSDQDVADLISFLETLTDPISTVGRLGVPETVPSGLPLDQ